MVDDLPDRRRLLVWWSASVPKRISIKSRFSRIPCVWKFSSVLLRWYYERKSERESARVGWVGSITSANWEWWHTEAELNSWPAGAALSAPPTMRALPPPPPPTKIPLPHQQPFSLDTQHSRAWCMSSIRDPTQTLYPKTWHTVVQPVHEQPTTSKCEASVRRLKHVSLLPSAGERTPITLSLFKIESSHTIHKNFFSIYK